MYSIKTILLIAFVCLPLSAQKDITTVTLNPSIFSSNPLASSASCKQDAKEALEYCLEVRPESQWDICEKAYYRALSKC